MNTHVISALTKVLVRINKYFMMTLLHSFIELINKVDVYLFPTAEKCVFTKWRPV